MKNNLINILSNSNKDIDNQQLMDYLGNKLSKEKEHEIEMQMNADPFIEDAIEGLQEIKNEKKLADIAELLNKNLLKQLAKNDKKRKRRLKDQPFSYLAILLILLLIILSFIVIKKYLDAAPERRTQTKSTLLIIVNKLKASK